MLLSQIFGGSHADKIGSFAIGIAPEDHMCDTDDSSIGSSDSGGGKKIKWLPEIEWETKKGGGEKKEKGHHSSGSIDSILTPPPQNAEVVSAKVTAGLTIDISPTPFRPSTASQSPGLIVYPSTFIPMSAAELEAHASKHLHVLLGCKCSLIDYISGFKDDHGERLVCDQELTDLFWDYEWYCTISFSYISHKLICGIIASDAGVSTGHQSRMKYTPSCLMKPNQNPYPNQPAPVHQLARTLRSSADQEADPQSRPQTRETAQSLRHRPIFAPLECLKPTNQKTTKPTAFNDLFWVYLDTVSYSVHF
jgi:hypothetical protein